MRINSSPYNVIKNTVASNYFKGQRGVTLIELIVFIVVTAIIVISLSSVFRQAMVSLEKPAINNQILDMAYSQLNAVLSRRFDENSPDDGTPCGVVISCAGFGLDAGENINNVNRFDDVDDFNGYADNPKVGFFRSVRVTSNGTQFGVPQEYVKRVDVTVRSSNGDSVMLTAYKVNH